jgi:hypothetical protein
VGFFGVFFLTLEMLRKYTGYRPDLHALANQVSSNWHQLVMEKKDTKMGERERAWRLSVFASQSEKTKGGLRRAHFTAKIMKRSNFEREITLITSREV